MDQRVLEKFRSEAPLAWEQTRDEFHRFFENNDGWQLHLQLTGSTPEGVIEISKTIKRIGTNYALSQGTPPIAPQPPGREYLEQIAFLCNPQYVASIKRSSENQRWVLSKLTRIPANSESIPLAIAGILENEHPLAGSMLDAVKSAIHPYGYCPFGSRPYTKTWFELDELQIETIEERDDSGRSLVEVMLKYQDKVYTGSARENRARLCTAVFDSTNNWCLMHAESQLEYHATDKLNREKTTIDYEYETTHGIQYVKSSKQRVMALRDESVFFDNDDNITMAVSKLSPSEFTLSAFGLPEPDWYIPPRPWWLYASLTGMALLLVGAVLLRCGKQMWNRN